LNFAAESIGVTRSRGGRGGILGAGKSSKQTIVVFLSWVLLCEHK